MGENPKELREKFKSHGFTNVKTWYQVTNFNFNGFEEYYSKIIEKSVPKQIELDNLAKTIPDVREKVKARMGEKWNQMMDEEKFHLFENLMIVADKP
jgi:hypothetical protein